MSNKFIISSNNSDSLNIYLKYLKFILNKNNVKISVLHLPTKIKRITLLKSPHVYKKAKEQFEKRTFKKIVYIDTSVENVKLFLTNKPKSVFLTMDYNIN